MTEKTVPEGGAKVFTSGSSDSGDTFRSGGDKKRSPPGQDKTRFGARTPKERRNHNQMHQRMYLQEETPSPLDQQVEMKAFVAEQKVSSQGETL